MINLEMLNWLFKATEHQHLWEVRSLSYNLHINIKFKCLYFGGFAIEKRTCTVTIKAFLWKRLPTSPQWRQIAPTCLGQCTLFPWKSRVSSADAWKWGAAAIQIHIRAVQDIWAAAALQRAQSSTFFVLRLISFPMKLEKNRSEFMPDGGSGFFLD